jgi:solute:Na+ symporter, SSS family
MNLSLFFTLFTLLAGATFWLGRKAAAKTSETSEDFFLMGRKLGLFGLTMTLLATQIGGGALLGASQEAYIRGWSVLFYPLGMVLGMLVLGLGYGAKMRKLNITTVPEIFETIYRSPFLRKIGSLLSIASLFLILVGQGIAARKFFTSLNFHGDMLFILFWSLLVAYTTIGGLGAVVKTDILQVGFILFSLGIAVIAALVKTDFTHVSAISLPHIHEQTPWLTWMLMPFLFMLIEQDMGQRCFAAKGPRTVTMAALISAAVLLAVSFIPIFFGYQAAQMGIKLDQGSSILIVAVQAFTNPYIATFVICAILMAVSSTADSLLCSVSSNIVCDFKKLGKSVAASRLITFFVGIATLFLSFLFENVVSILMFSYELAVSMLFVPVTMAIWRKNPAKISAMTSMILGAAGFAIFHIWSTPIPKELCSLACSLSGFFLCEWMQPLLSEKKLSNN